MFVLKSKYENLEKENAKIQKELDYSISKSNELNSNSLKNYEIYDKEISALKKQIAYLKGLSVFNVEYSSGGRIRQISVEAATCRVDGKNTIFYGANNEFIAMFEGVITVIKE